VIVLVVNLDTCLSKPLCMREIFFFIKKVDLQSVLDIDL
jgi:hypothetical protein